MKNTPQTRRKLIKIIENSDTEDLINLVKTKEIVSFDIGKNKTVLIKAVNAVHLGDSSSTESLYSVNKKTKSEFIKIKSIDMLKLIFKMSNHFKGKNEAMTVDPNREDSAGLTALHWASLSGDMEVCEILVANGSRKDIKARGTGVTPVGLCSQTRPKVKKFLEA